MMQLFMRLFGKKLVTNAVAKQVQGGVIDVKLGWSLLRDKRVPIKSRLLALAIGAVAVAALISLEAPVELLLGMILPFAVLPFDMVLDGAEAVVGPFVVAAILMPYLAPPELVQQVRAERTGQVIDAEFSPAPKRSGLFMRGARQQP